MASVPYCVGPSSSDGITPGGSKRPPNISVKTTPKYIRPTCRLYIIKKFTTKFTKKCRKRYVNHFFCQGMRYYKFQDTSFQTVPMTFVALFHSTSNATSKPFNSPSSKLPERKKGDLPTSFLGLNISDSNCLGC